MPQDKYREGDHKKCFSFRLKPAFMPSLGFQQEKKTALHRSNPFFIGGPDVPFRCTHFAFLFLHLATTRKESPMPPAPFMTAGFSLFFTDFFSGLLLPGAALAAANDCTPQGQNTEEEECEQQKPFKENNFFYQERFSRIR